MTIKDHIVMLDNLLAFKSNLREYNLIRKVVLLACMIMLTTSLLKVHPIHTPLTPNTTAANMCLPDEVYITDTTLYYYQNTTKYDSMCIKCTQFAPFAQKCQIYSIRLEIISVTITQTFKDKMTSPPSIICRTDNSYMVDPANSQICVDSVMEKAVPNDPSVVVYNRQCYPSIPGCYDCWNLGSGCQFCGYGFYQKNVNSINDCLSLSTDNPHCLKTQGNDPKKCQVCQSGYYRQQTGGDQFCFICPGNCAKCSESGGVGSPVVCTKCKYGYQYPSDNCAMPPFPCTQFLTCNQCINRTAPSNKVFQQCINCPSPATQFLNRQATKCITTCQIAQPHCQKCYTSQLDQLPKCRKCLQGFYVSWFGGCQSCQAPIKYCSKCDHSQKCTQCIGQMAYLKSNTQCQLCSVNITNCRTCKKNPLTLLSTNPVQCIKCSQGFRVNSTTGLCDSCDPKCKVCNNDSSCEYCYNSNPVKYYLEPGSKKCLTCQQIIPNCAQCQLNFRYSNQTQCIYCDENYALYQPAVGTRKVCDNCSKIDTNCIACKKGNICTACNIASGTYLQKSTNKCQPCIPPCKTCLTKTKCLTCSQPYLVIVSEIRGKCGSCWSVIDNCQLCQIGATPPYQCTKCKAPYICETNPTLSLQCKLCPDGQYPINSTSSGILDSCTPCQSRCLTCHNATSCKSCLPIYHQKLIDYNTVQCIDKCGDQKLIYLPCDLYKGNVSDGCTSQCQVQEGFICELYYDSNNSLVVDQNDKAAIQNYIDLLPKTSLEHYHSVCSYNGSLKMQVNKINKEKFENTITFEIKLFPFLHAYTLLSHQEINSLISATYKGVILPQYMLTTRLSKANQSLTVQITQQKSFLQPLRLTLSHSNITITDNKRKFKYTTDSFVEVNTKDEKSLSAFYYSESDLQLWSIVHIGMQVSSVLAIVCALGGMLIKNLAGLQLLWILQSMYTSLFWYQQPLSLPLYSLSGLSLSHGYNPTAELNRAYNTQTINSTITRRLLYTYNVHSGDYSSMFVSIPYTVLLIIIVYYLSYVGWVVKDVKNPKVKRWAQYFQVYFYNDGLLIVGLFMLLNLLNQAFLLSQNWHIIHPQSQFFSTILTLIGLICQALILAKWLRKKQTPGYEKIGQQTIVPYDTFLNMFSHHNFPILRQKFYTVYIYIIILATIACVYAAFYPLIPCLLYVFLAFIIMFYQPYSKTLANYRAAYFSLVIGYGYLLRVIYLFSYQQNSMTLNGIIEHHIWTIWLWIAGLVGAFILLFIDFISTYRQNKKQHEKLQQQFKLSIEKQDKQFEMKMFQEEKKNYQSHKGNLENILYNRDFMAKLQSNQQKQIKNIRKNLNNEEDDQSVTNINNNKNKKSTSKKAIRDESDTNKMIREKPSYNSINHNKINNNNNKKKSHQHQGTTPLIDKQTLGNKQWLLAKKKQIKEQKLRKQQQKIHSILMSAYKFVSKVFLAKEQIIRQKNNSIQRMTIKERLVKQKLAEDNEEEQNEQNNSITISNTGQDNETNNNKRITQQQLDKYKLQKTVQKQQRMCIVKPERKNFPKVEIYYQKAQKLTKQELTEVKNNQKTSKKVEKQQQQQQSGQQHRVIKKSRKKVNLTIMKEQQ